MTVHEDLAGLYRPDPGLGEERNGFDLEDGVQLRLWHYRRAGAAVQWQVRQRVAPGLYRVAWVRIVDETILHPDSLWNRAERALADSTCLWSEPDPKPAPLRMPLR